MAKIIAEYALFLEFSDNDTLDPKLATSMLEQLEADLQGLPSPDRERFSGLMRRVADSQELPAHAEYLRSF